MNKTRSQKKREAKRRWQRAPINVAVVRAAAMTGLSMAEAEAEHGLEKPLAEIFAKHPKHAAAWQRGRMLFNVSCLAKTGTPDGEIAGQLGVKSEAFADQITRDAELRDVLQQGRVSHLQIIRAGLTQAAIKGNPKILDEMLRMLCDETSRGQAVDFTHMTAEQVFTALDISRPTLYDSWVKKSGGSFRNPDKTFNLRLLWKWRLDYQSELITSGKIPGAGGGTGSEEDLRQERVKKLRLENEVTEARLLDVQSVIVDRLGFAQVIIDQFESWERLFPMLLEDKKARKIEKLFRREKDAARRRLVDQLAQGITLPAAIEARTREFLGGLFKDDE